MKTNNIKDNLGLVVAKGMNNEIGYKKDLIWRIKEDLLYFKNVTMGSYMIMGKNTYESMPKKLPGRKYIILSRNKDLEILPEHLLFNNIEQVLQFVSECKDEKFNIVGGGIVYRDFLPYVGNMHITEIKDSFPEADTFFPSFQESEWEKESQDTIYCPDNKVEYKHTFYLRKK